MFFNTRRFAFSHVGIYLGDNRFIHAPRRGREVEVATLDQSYWQKHFNGARRLLGVLPEMIPSLIAEASAAVPAPAPAELRLEPATASECGALARRPAWIVRVSPCAPARCRRSTSAASLPRFAQSSALALF